MWTAFLGSGTNYVHQAWYLNLWSVVIHYPFVINCYVYPDIATPLSAATGSSREGFKSLVISSGVMATTSLSPSLEA